jgi:hypothetical protein
MSRSSGSKREAGSFGRRRILAGIGASGVAAAVAVFGRSGAADAIPGYGCCNLQYRPTVSVSSCLSGKHYVWYCGLNELQCQCCEVKDSSGSNIRSAYTCY